MRGERQLLRLGEHLVGLACRPLPRDVREERYREWAAELPAILHDPQIRPAPRRAIRMLAYAADTLRGTPMTPVGARRRGPGMPAVFIVAALAMVAGTIWVIVQAPGNGPAYMQLAWSVLILAYLLSELVHSAWRTTALLFTGATLAGVVSHLWSAADAPGDWANYFWAALLLLSVPVWWLAHRRARTKRA